MKRWLRRIFWAILALVLFSGAALCLFDRQEAGRREAVATAGLPIAPVYQFDYPAAVCFVAGEYKSVATSGCGATCMAMVIGYLTGDGAQTPQTLFETAWKNGDYFGSGLSHEALTRLAQANGVTGTWIGRDEDRLRQALTDGRPVIAHMGPGQFADEGHYILLRGLTDDGLVVMNDPNSEENTYRAFDLGLIVREAKTNAPFMVCRAME